MPFEDLREFAQKLEENGDLVRIKREVDWNLEAAAIMRRGNEIEAPAQLFEKIKGYSESYRMMGSPLATRVTEGQKGAARVAPAAASG